MTTPNEYGGKFWARYLGELCAVILLVFALGWIGVRLAEAVHDRPVAARSDGTIKLQIAKSDRSGNVAFKEGSGYAGWWHCQGRDWRVLWRFATAFHQLQSVSMTFSSSGKLTGEIVEATIHDEKTAADQVLRQEIAGADSPGKWRTLNLGEVSLAPGAYTIVIKSGSDGLTNLNVKSVVIRPSESKL